MTIRRAHPDGAALTVEQAADELELAARAPARRPYVVANMALTADGHGAINGRSRGIGGAADRAFFHALRGRVDAVMAGTGTLAAERYGRLVPDPAARAARARRGLSPDPLACFVTRSGRMPLDIPLLRDPDSTVIVLSAAPVQLVRSAATVRVTRLSEPSMAAALAALREEHGVRSLLCEGGPTVLSALVRERLVDELFLTVAPLLAGGDPSVPALAGPVLREPARLELVWALEAAGELLLRYRLSGPPDEPAVAPT